MSLSGLPPERAYPLLSELATIHVVTEQVPGRYSFHDLLRMYATERVMFEDSGAERGAATRRVLDHYLHTARAAADQLSPYRDHLTIQTDPAPGVVPERLDPHGPALLAWLTAERAVLLAAVNLATEAGHHAHAYQLAWALGAHLARSGRWQEWAKIQQTALDAAERLNDPAELARALPPGLGHLKLGS